MLGFAAEARQNCLVLVVRENSPSLCAGSSNFLLDKRPDYKIDLNLKEENEGYHLLVTAPGPLGRKSLVHQEKQLLSSGTPTDGSPDSAAALATSSQQQKALQAKLKSKAMSIATQPGQQILMNAFMLWMSGKTLNIFSISVTSQAILGPLNSLLSLDKTFGPMQDQNADVQLPKLIFVALNLVWLGIGLYKMSSMRLLPTTSADWTGSIAWKDMLETTSIPPT
jgi:ER membrane protein complex subunit 4